MTRSLVKYTETHWLQLSNSTRSSSKWSSSSNCVEVHLAGRFKLDRLACDRVHRLRSAGARPGDGVGDGGEAGQQDE